MQNVRFILFGNSGQMLPILYVILSGSKESSGNQENNLQFKVENCTSQTGITGKNKWGMCPWQTNNNPAYKKLYHNKD